MATVASIATGASPTPPAGAEASGSYHCIIQDLLSEDFTITASATAPSAVVAGTTVELTDITITIFGPLGEDADNVLAALVLEPMGHPLAVLLEPSGFTGPAPSEAVFTGGTDSFVLDGAPGTAVDVTIQRAAFLLIGWPPAPVLSVPMDCNPVGDPLVLARILVIDPDPQEAVADVIADIGDLVAGDELKAGQARGLTRPLDNAIRSLAGERVESACDQLHDFVAEAKQKVSDGALSPAAAADLIAQVEAIQAELDCT